jgi:Ca2+-binding RTX toxin-like protein
MNAHIQKLEQRRLMSLQIDGGSLTITANDSAPHVIDISLNAQQNMINVNVNGANAGTAAAPIEKIHILCGSGNDQVTFSYGFHQRIALYGGLGNDIITGTGGINRLRVYAEGGSDQITTRGRGRDTLYGGGGDDTISSGGGDDYLSGDGGNDNINGGAGHDQLFGDSGDDFISAIDGQKDTVNGGSGHDAATVDHIDVLTSIELFAF